jgi:DNA-binding NarL/FixJ family response regulator
MIKILVYEDNEDFRGALLQLIRSAIDYECVGSFVDCNNVDEELEVLRPDVILMDIEMPQSDGIEGVRSIRKKNREIPIIMLTVFDDDKTVLDAICAGASGYLLKKYAFRKLFDSIDEVLAGGAPMSSNIAKLVLEHVKGINSLPSKDFDLTKREKDILGSLVKGNNFKMIGADLGISVETVKTHTKKIYEKLQVHSQTGAVVKAIKNKLI